MGSSVASAAVPPSLELRLGGSFSGRPSSASGDGERKRLYGTRTCAGSARNRGVRASENAVAAWGVHNRRALHSPARDPRGLCIPPPAEARPSGSIASPRIPRECRALRAIRASPPACAAGWRPGSARSTPPSSRSRSRAPSPNVAPGHRAQRAAAAAAAASPSGPPSGPLGPASRAPMGCGVSTTSSLFVC